MAALMLNFRELHLKLQALILKCPRAAPEGCWEVTRVGRVGGVVAGGIFVSVKVDPSMEPTPL